ncbi:MAG: hypothetical protein AAB400_02970 [Patescibacteria group bacterium]
MTDTPTIKKIIAFTGRKACGKGVAGNLLAEKYGALRIDYSSSLHEALNILGIPETQDTIPKLSSFLRSRFGVDVMQRAVVKKIRASSASRISLFGARRLTDFDDIKKEFSFHLLYIDSNFEARYQRYIARNQRAGDSEMDRERFRLKDEEEPELQIESLKPLADAVIDNNATLQEFEKKLLEVFDTLDL